MRKRPRRTRSILRLSAKLRKVATMTEKTQRGLCCHEAGHAVVAWSFGVHVVAVYVSFSVARGWHGGTDYIDGSTLHYMDQVTNFAAGRTSEEVFGCLAHYGAWLADLGEILCCSPITAFPKISIGHA
jgi:hypothetical protein